MDGFAVISDMDKNDKLDTASELIKPAFSILDPKFTYSVSQKQTAAGTADIMSHVLDVYKRQKDGSYKWILDHCRIVKDAENQETIIGIMLETTEIENTREALELTLDRHRVIMEQTSDILFEWDITTDKVLCSSHWKEKFGYELGIYKLSDCYQLPYLHPDDLPKEMCIRDRIRIY